jgi:hypothetical protein
MLLQALTEASKKVDKIQEKLSIESDKIFGSPNTLPLSNN